MARHSEIHAALRARITSGFWAPGERIPREADLADEFGVTRPTVGRALRALADAGLIERRRRAGTRVVRRTGRDARVTIPLVRAEIVRRGMSYRHLLIGSERRDPPPDIRATLELDAGDEALHLRSIHYGDGIAWQLEDRWISFATVPEAAAQDFASVSANEWLLSTIPFTTAEHVFRATAAQDEDAEALGIASGEPVFEIARTTWLDGQPVTTVRLMHPGARFSMSSSGEDAWRDPR